MLAAMHVVRHDNGTSWLRAAADALDPAIDGLALAFATRLGDDPATGGYFATVEDGGLGAPAYAVLSPGRKMMFVGRAGPEACDLVAEDLRQVLPRLEAVMGPAPSTANFVEAWTRRAGATARRGWAQRLFVLGELRAPRPTSGEMREATAADRAVLAQWFQAFDEETQTEAAGRDTGPIVDSLLEARRLFVWDHGGPVCMAVHNEHGPTAARIGAVYTPPHLRKMGYATALTATFSAHLRDAGYAPLTLFAQTANAGSNRIYTGLGYEPVQDFQDWWFGYPD